MASKALTPGNAGNLYGSSAPALLLGKALILVRGVTYHQVPHVGVFQHSCADARLEAMLGSGAAKAIAHYEQAADYYKGEESNSLARQKEASPDVELFGSRFHAQLVLVEVLGDGCSLKQLKQYQKAIEIYEQVGTNTMDNPLLKYSAKEYFFKAALCHFIVDELNAKFRWKILANKSGCRERTAVLQHLIQLLFSQKVNHTLPITG
ncbi:uncharacterized protein LOC133624821 isoform X1 [Colius striatus]|uniref:uncharacterized protein LOC133624821 isoform X1 n=1 Tax=Colius striatus TaxID=57412 RepID=UPI002B1DBBB5|nr:uncharacterized protein LOC133624821 isoform X1 [Colius striatus]XP_061845405.1 uncharacterized protein LOC133624821 isoform X1 [Colius striatus]